MPTIAYLTKRLSTPSLKIVAKANDIIEEYVEKGFDLTLRQLYYQFVSRGIFDELGFKVDESGSTNNPKSYHRLASIINDARLAGLIDWDHIVDRTRGIESLVTWVNPQEMIEYRARSFMIDKWATQEYRPEVWIEKEALAGVFERVCRELRIPYLSCRGYTSQSEMWRAGQRLKQYADNGQIPFILHFGDHDPSGIDMSRDIIDRLEMFTDGSVEFNRLALNIEQVEEHNPPPNPAKTTDSRAQGYIAKFGNESWELDALDPTLLATLVRDQITKLIDADLWKSATEEEDEHKRLLNEVSENWSDLTSDL